MRYNASNTTVPQTHDDFFLRHCKRNEVIEKNRIFRLLMILKRLADLSLKILICKLTRHFWLFAKTVKASFTLNSLIFFLVCVRNVFYSHLKKWIAAARNDNIYSKTKEQAVNSTLNSTKNLRNT
jgi:hypothetical protein